MGKPESMSHKEWFIKKMSLEKNIPERVIMAVVNHQFDGAREALKENDTIEISNFGKFCFNRKKAHKKMEKYLSQRQLFTKMLSEETSPEKQRNISLRLKTINRNIEILKPKLNV